MAKPNARTFSSTGNTQSSMEDVVTGVESEGGLSIEEESAPAEASESQAAVAEAAVASVGVVEDAPVVGVVQRKDSAVQEAPTYASAVAAARASGVGVVEQTQAAVGDELAGKLAGILKDVPAAYQIDITRLRLYCSAMAPGKPLDNASGAREQAALYRLIQNIINRQEAHFTALFTALLAVFHAERKGSLGDRYRNRFMEHVTLSSADRTAFQNLTHMLAITADPKSRAIALKQIALDKTLANGLTEEGRLRVLQYYGV